MSDTSTDETVVTTAPSNEPSTPVVGTADVEAAKREAAQAQIRANQLQNELDRIKAEQTAAKQKQLEEKEEFKTLYEQTNGELERIRQEAATKEQTLLLQNETSTIFSEYPEKVVELAKTAGLNLTDASDESKAALKAKLDIFKASVGNPQVTANNPSNPTQVTETGDLVKRSNPFEGSPMAEASAKGDLKPQFEYIRNLKGIQRMKEIAQNGA